MNKLINHILALIILLSFSGCFDEQEFVFPDEFSYIAFSNGAVDVSEGETSSVQVDILYGGSLLSSGINIPLSISSSGGVDAIEGVDYAIPGGLGDVLIPPGSAVASITIDILNNDLAVGPRTLILEIGDIPGHNTGSPDDASTASFVVTIAEDDLFIFGFTSFEELDLTGLSHEYTKSGTAELNNNPGEAPVDYVSTGGELGFDSSFLPSNIGDDGGEIIGVNDGDFEDDGVFSYPDGNQGYAAADLDGALEIVFDEVPVPESATFLQVDLSAFFFDGGDWEPGNGLEIIWRTSEGDESLLNIRENGDAELAYSDGSIVPLSEWLGLFAVAENPVTGRPVVIIENDNLDDLTLIDLLVVKGF